MDRRTFFVRLLANGNEMAETIRWKSNALRLELRLQQNALRRNHN